MIFEEYFETEFTKSLDASSEARVNGASFTDAWKTGFHAAKEIQHTEQKVLFIPESDLNLDDGWHVVSARAHTSTDGYPAERVGVQVTIRKTHYSD